MLMYGYGGEEDVNQESSEGQSMRAAERIRSSSIIKRHSKLNDM